MTDREKFLNTARSYIGKDGYFVCKTKIALDAVYDWCAFAVSAIMKDCGFIGKYTSGVHSFASDEGRYGDGKYGTWFLKYSQAVQPGDIIMFRYSSLNPIDKYSASHVGIVEAVSGNTLTTLEGNVEGWGDNWACNSTFKRKTRYLNDSSIYAFFRPKWKESTSTGTSSQKTKTVKKTVDELAKEVIAGKWSAGDERKTKLTAAGYDYSAVQNRVNEILSGKVQNKKSVDELAHEVICGKWGNGEDRRKKLTAAGYNYSDVQDRVNELMDVSNVLREGSDADGGYLVPEEYDKRIIDVLNGENIMRTLGTKIKTSGDHKINVAATKPAASWIDEGEPLVWGDATFDQILLDAHKLHVAIKVTEELLYDNSFGLENYIITQFGKALANAEEDAFLNGNGRGRPTGIFAATGGGVIASTTTTLKGDDIINLVYALKRPYRKKAAFIMNDKILATVRTLKDSEGQYLWQQSFKDGEPERLAGYPVYTSEYAPTNMISFGDYSYYNIGDRGTRSFKKLTELFAGNDMVGFVAKERVDGKLVLPEAVQILKIGTTGKVTKP